MEDMKREIYLIRHNSGAVKIGYSKNPERRVRALDVMPYPVVELEFSKRVRDAKSVERELHERYSDKQIRGEWFDLTETEVEELKKWLTTVGEGQVLEHKSGKTRADVLKVQEKRVKLDYRGGGTEWLQKSKIRENWVSFHTTEKPRIP